MTTMRHDFAFKGGDTFGSILDRHRGEGPGFGVLRIVLAIMILWIHTSEVSRLPSVAAVTALEPSGYRASFSPAHILIVFMVPAFFALSGFLVTGSALRLRATAPFLTFRLLRILPALFVEVTLSALVLGPLFTQLPLASYFHDPQFFRYFGNIVGWVTFHLPGVFEANNVSVVNANLWTLPAEFNCYLITAALMIFGTAYNRTVLTAILAVITVALIGLNTFSDFGLASGVPHAEVTITYYFFVGMLFFHWKEYLLASWKMFGLATIAGYVFLCFQHTIYLAPIFVSYVTIFLGVRGLPEFKWLKSRDYSYGIYLYGFPISQALVALAPSVRGHRVLVFVLALACTMAFAATSWHMIERRALALKSRLPEALTGKKAAMPAVIAAE
jgi:peptidoglycan/LPS O-acetylase OafA/YrhL